MGTAPWYVNRIVPLASLRVFLQCRICRRVGATVLLSILAIEAAILIPSYENYEDDLLFRLQSAGRAEIAATYRSVGHGRDHDLLLMGQALIRTSGAGTESSHVRGGRLHGADGSPIGSFGEVPALTLEAVRSGAGQTRRSADGMHYDVVWPAEETGLPISVAARLDASRIGPELRAFVWRNSGLVLLISVVASAVTMAIFGRSVLLPMLRLRTSLTRAHQDPAHADRYVLAETRADEMGELMTAADLLLHGISSRLESQERRLSETADHLLVVLGNSVTSIITMNSNGVVTSFNPAAEKLFGYKAEQVISQNVSMLMPDPDRAAHDGYVANYRTSGKKDIVGRTRMVVGRHEDGHTISLELSLGEMSVRGENHFVGFLIDISERVAAEKQQHHLGHAQKMDAIGQSTGGIAHDYNNLLMVIDGYARRALRDMSDMKAAGKALEEVIGATQKATKLTRQLLNFSRHTMMEKRVFRAGETVAELEGLLRDSVGEGHKVGFKVEDSDACVASDPAEFGQAIVNLAVNARDAMPNGGLIVIGARVDDPDADFFARHPGLSPGRYAAISVRDQGAGIEEEVLARIFDPFFTTKERGEGTGLGLAMVYGFAQQSGGVVDVATVPNRGSIFTIYLPVVDQPPELIAATEEKEHRGKGETVLLVEDDIRLLELLHDILRDLGYHVLAAGHGLEALEKDESYEETIDLLLSDVDMPGLDGFELYDILRERRPDMKVVFITGRPKFDGRIVAAPETARILQKPIETGLLARVLRSELEGRQARPFGETAVG